jgi:hypothetical protein
MSNLGFIESLLSVFRGGERRSLGKAFEEVTKFTRIGVPDKNTKSENFAGAFYESTTSTTAGQEIAIPHQLGIAPYLLVPVLTLASSGYELIPLKTTTPADGQNIYVSSSLTGRPFRFYSEG